MFIGRRLYIVVDPKISVEIIFPSLELREKFKFQKIFFKLPKVNVIFSESIDDKAKE